jgi:hypothetical protein
VAAISRRNILTDILPGSIVAVASFTTISCSIAPGLAEATQTAQAVMVHIATCVAVTVVGVAGGRRDVAGGTGDIVSAAGASRRE